KIAVREKSPHGEHKSVGEVWSENDPLAARVSVFKRSRDHEEPTLGAAKVTRDARERPAPNCQRNRDSLARGDTQHAVERCAPKNLSAVAIAACEGRGAIDLRRREQAAVMDGIEMLAVESMR